MSGQLALGVAEVDITPPVGTQMCGYLTPRTSDGIDDPLLVKAIVFEAGGERIALGVFDLTLLWRSEGDEAIRLAQVVDFFF